MIRLKKDERYSFSLSYKFHDYLSVCPSFFLLDKDTLPCDPCDYEYCRTCIKHNPNRAVLRVAIRDWRQMFSSLFEAVDSFDMFSNYSKSLVLKIYPQIEDRIRVTYHKALLSENAAPFQQPEEIEEIRIAFVGRFNTSKGSSFFRDLTGTFLSNGIPARFYLVGFNSTDRPLQDITPLGKYERDNLGEILTQNKINLVVYSSINNETFSYVAQELMLLQVPLVVFPCGAPQERIRGQYEFGEVAESVTLEALCDATLRLIDRLFVQRDDYVCLPEKLKEELAGFKDAELELQYPSRQPYIAPEPPAPPAPPVPEAPLAEPKHGVAQYFSMTANPPFGTKEAMEIYINKRIPFLFKKTATRIPADKRRMGIKEAIKIRLIKSLLKE